MRTTLTKRLPKLGVNGTGGRNTTRPIFCELSSFTISWANVPVRSFMVKDLGLLLVKVVGLGVLLVGKALVVVSMRMLGKNEACFSIARK